MYANNICNWVKIQQVTDLKIGENLSINTLVGWFITWCDGSLLLFDIILLVFFLFVSYFLKILFQKELFLRLPMHHAVLGSSHTSTVDHHHRWHWRSTLCLKSWARYHLPSKSPPPVSSGLKHWYLGLHIWLKICHLPIVDIHLHVCFMIFWWRLLDKIPHHLGWFNSCHHGIFMNIHHTNWTGWIVDNKSWKMGIHKVWVGRPSFPFGLVSWLLGSFPYATLCQIDLKFWKTKNVW